MATLVDLSIYKKFLETMRPAELLSSKNIDENEEFLALVRSECPMEKFDWTVYMKSKKNPELKWNFTFSRNFVNELKGEVGFSGTNLPSKLEISFYYINSEGVLQFLETLKLTDVNTYSHYYLAPIANFFKTNSFRGQTTVEIQRDKVFNGCLSLLFSIKHCASSIKLQTDKERPTKFVSLYENKVFPDFKIVCKEQEFCVHKAFLAFRSPVFQAMLENKMQEAQKDLLTIEDFEPEVIEQMIHYIYADEIKENLTQDVLKNLIIIADKYELKKLQLICIREITKLITTMNESFEIVKLLELCNLTDYKKDMFQFIQDNAHILKND